MPSAMPGPNAAIYYALDAYDTSRPHLMGRHSAGEGFLRGFVRHGGVDRLYCYARHAGDAQDFAKRVQTYGATVPITWIRRSAAAGRAGLPVLSDGRGRRIGVATPTT